MNFSCKIYFLFSMIVFGCGAQTSVDTVSSKKVDWYAGKTRNTLQGRSAIEFEAELLNGPKIALSKFKGKVILLNFWYIGCAPCMGEIQDINEIYRKFNDTDVVILSLARSSITELNKFNIRKNGSNLEKIQYPIVPGCEKIAESYSITGYPTNILIDKKYKIRLVQSGASIQSLKNYVIIYGDEGLSKEWKNILKEYGNDKSLGMGELLSGMIEELLKE